MGLTIILYLFGYETMYTDYLTNAGGTGISNPILNMGETIMKTITDNINITIIAGGALGLIAMFLVFKTAASTILTYAIPLIILVALNIFVFPISGITDSLVFANSVFTLPIITTGVFLVFNAVYILGVIEFVRGGSV